MKKISKKTIAIICIIVIFAIFAISASAAAFLSTRSNTLEFVYTLGEVTTNAAP